MKSETIKRAHRAFEAESRSILKTAQQMNWDSFSQAVTALAAAPRIAVTGCGHSGIAGMHFAHSLCCIERPARFLPPAEATHGASGYLQKGDVLVWASRGGKTDELAPILDISRQKGAIIIGLTENISCPLAKQSHVTIPFAVTEETDRHNSQGTSSFVALSAVFDALQTALIDETDFQSSRFALIHPGGAVGKRLRTH